MKPQVEKSHYDFRRYVHKSRWASMWHQLDEALKWKPVRALEIGPGPGFFKSMCGVVGIEVETVDLDPDLHPDHVCSVLELPFEQDSYDVAFAFQMLEHLPYRDSMAALAEMARVARDAVVISLPDAAGAYPFSVFIPGRGPVPFFVSNPFSRRRKHVFDGEHYWEVNKAGYALKRVLRDLETHSGGRIQRSFRVPEFPYHRFFVIALK